MTPNPLPEQLLDYGSLKGGLVRMMERFREEGTMTGNEEADVFLRSSANAVLLGMLFDQRVRAEYAFTGPVRMFDRLRHLDMKKISAMSDENQARLADSSNIATTSTMPSRKVYDYYHRMYRLTRSVMPKEDILAVKNEPKYRDNPELLDELLVVEKISRFTGLSA